MKQTYKKKPEYLDVVFVVDDTQMNLQVIAGLLRRTKMDIKTVTSGTECIECFGRESFDIVF